MAMPPDKCPPTSDPIVAALDGLRTDLEKDEKLAQETAASKEARKQDLAALQEAVKQVDQTVKDYEQAYKAIEGDRRRIKAEAEVQRAAAAKEMNEAQKTELNSDIEYEGGVFKEAAKTFKALTERYDPARKAYEKAAQEHDTELRSFDRLRSYLKYAQAGVGKLKEYRDRLTQELNKSNFGAAYVLGYLVEATLAEEYYLPDGGEPKKPEVLRAELRVAWQRLHKARQDLRTAKVAFDLLKAEIKDAEKKLDEARKQRDQDLLQEAAEVDRARAQALTATAKKPAAV